MSIPNLSSRFELINCYASGRLFKLYLVRHVQADTPALAFLKIPDGSQNLAESDLAANTEFELRNRKTLATLQRPIAIHHFKEGTCLEYEYFEGVRLAEVIKFCRKNSIDLGPDMAAHLTAKILASASICEQLSLANDN